MFLSEIKNFVSTSATIVTILQFLSGIDICKTVIRQGSTGEISGLPFVAGSFSTSLWLTYALLLNDIPMTVTNLVGLILQVIYLLIYLKYCVSLGPRKALKRQILFFGLLFGAVSYYIFISGEAKEKVSRTVGLMCCIASVAFCVSPLASLREVLRTKSSAVLPFPLILSMVFVGGLWCLYGVIIDNPFVIYPNFLIFTIAGFQLLLFVIFPQKLKDAPLIVES